MNTDLNGENISGVELDSPPKRGRPQVLNDGILQGIRDSLVWLLESNWGEVGYELGQALQVEDIGNALSKISAGPYGDKITMFMRPTETHATTKQMRKMRIERGEIVERMHGAFDNEQKCREALNASAGALQRSLGSNHQQTIERENERRKTAVGAAEQGRRALEEQERKLRNKIADAEAGFARRELLRFVLERRYSLTPLHFANAMAGLPYMGWRQSYKRCGRSPCQIANGLLYRQFKTIARLFNSKVKAQSLVERMRLFLQRQTRRKDDAVEALKRKWYYLRRAIEHVESGNHPIDSLPFRIMAEFQHLLRSATAEDQLLEQDAQLW